MVGFNCVLLLYEEQYSSQGMGNGEGINCEKPGTGPAGTQLNSFETFIRLRYLSNATKCSETITKIH